MDDDAYVNYVTLSYLDASWYICYISDIFLACICSAS